MATVCAGCENSLYADAVKYSHNNKNAINAFRSHGVLPSLVLCKKCGNKCTLRSDRPTWQCNHKVSVPKQKKKVPCGFAISDYKDSFLGRLRFEPWKLILFISAWVRKEFSHSHIRENLQLSRETSVDWRSFCSEVTEHILANQEQIGGNNIIVEIDESKFGKTKYHRGRELQGVWVFGGIERDSKKSFIIPLLETSQRNAETLLPLIQTFIKPGSIIISDQWKAYNKISELGYQHQTVNHSVNFVDPVTGAHTQNIERLWKDIKSHVLREGIRKKYYSQYISRYLFMRSIPEPEKRLHAFLIAAAKLYVPAAQSESPTEATPAAGSSRVHNEPPAQEVDSDFCQPPKRARKQRPVSTFQYSSDADDSDNEFVPRN